MHVKSKPKSKIVQMRITDDLLKQWHQARRKLGFLTLAEMIRTAVSQFLARNGLDENKIEK